MRRTKIICTLGPATSTVDDIAALIRAGMDIARLNCSHGDAASLTALYHAVREAAAQAQRNVAVLMDLQGPKIRTGRMRDGQPVELIEGADVVITTDETDGDAHRFSTTYEALPSDVRPGDRIMLADGALELKVRSVRGAEVHCTVVHGGLLGSSKGINLPGVPVSAPSVTEKDREDLALALDLGADFVALSFVRSPDDVRLVKRCIADAGVDCHVVSKIERPEALDCFDEIAELTDAVMVARGDLGVEMPFDQVPQIQKQLIRRCSQLGTPVITATQMLESMIASPRPTRAEANDVANAIYDGTDAVMLSGETAVGRFPARTVSVMARICAEADAAIAADSERARRPWSAEGQGSLIGNAIGHAVYHLSENLDLKRIVVFSQSGFTATKVSRYRPRVPISAFTLDVHAQRRCALYWGVNAEQTVELGGIDETIAALDGLLLERGLAKRGDLVALVAGSPLAHAGATNLLKLHTVGESESL